VFGNGATSAALSSIAREGVRSSSSISKAKSADDTCAFGPGCNEGGQGRIDKLVAEVRKDHPDLPNPEGLNILAESGAGIDGDPDTHGIFDSSGQIRIATDGRDDYFVKGVIFHELAHLDEANHVAFGNKTLWEAHEFWFDGGHDDWTTSAGNQYRNWLWAKNEFPNRTNPYTKPSIKNAPWRQ